MDVDFLFGILIGAIASSFITMIGVASITQNRIQTQAASRGYAEYCIPDGSFAWKGECP